MKSKQSNKTNGLFFFTILHFVNTFDALPLLLPRQPELAPKLQASV